MQVSQQKHAMSYAIAWTEAENIVKPYLTAQKSMKAPVSFCQQEKRLLMTFRTTDCITRGSKSEKMSYLCNQNSLQLSTKTLLILKELSDRVISSWCFSHEPKCHLGPNWILGKKNEPDTGV